MNKRLIKQLAFDFAILYPLIAMVLLDSSLSGYAENAISFFGIFSLIIGTLCLFVSKDIANRKIEKGEKPRSGFHNFYCNSSTVVEVLIFASLGWYWCAAGFIVGLLSMSTIDDEMKK